MLLLSFLVVGGLNAAILCLKMMYWLAWADGILTRVIGWCWSIVRECRALLFMKAKAKQVSKFTVAIGGNASSLSRFEVFYLLIVLRTCNQLIR